MVVRIENSDFFWSFVMLGNLPMMDFTFLCKAYGVLKEQMWQAMNEVLNVYVRKEGMIADEKVRVDTKVYETNIHYLMDSSLLWDSFRTLARLMKQTPQDIRQRA